MAEPLRVITQTESWKQEASQHTIDMLQEWLDRAKAGEVVAVAVVGECVDGATISGFTRPRSRSQMLGVLVAHQLSHQPRLGRRVNAVQIKHPITGNWLKVSTITGRIIGQRKKPYAVPVKPIR